MTSEIIFETVKWYLHALWDNAWMKFLAWIVPWIFATIFNWHQELVWMVICLYSIDFIVWVCHALHQWEFNLTKLMKGAIKLLVYLALLSVAVSIDKVLHTWEVLIWMMFSFIILTDSISIIDKLNKLWFDVPIFLIKYLWLAKDKLECKVWDILNLTDKEKEILTHNDNSDNVSLINLTTDEKQDIKDWWTGNLIVRNK